MGRGGADSILYGDDGYLKGRRQKQPMLTAGLSPSVQAKCLTELTDGLLGALSQLGVAEAGEPNDPLLAAIAVLYREAPSAIAKLVHELVQRPHSGVTQAFNSIHVLKKRAERQSALVTLLTIEALESREGSALREAYREFGDEDMLLDIAESCGCRHKVRPWDV